MRNTPFIGICNVRCGDPPLIPHLGGRKGGQSLPQGGGWGALIYFLKWLHEEEICSCFNRKVLWVRHEYDGYRIMFSRDSYYFFPRFQLLFPEILITNLGKT